MPQLAHHRRWGDGRQWLVTELTGGPPRLDALGLRAQILDGGGAEGGGCGHCSRVPLDMRASEREGQQQDDDTSIHASTLQCRST